MSEYRGSGGCGVCSRSVPSVQSLASLRWLHSEFRERTMYEQRGGHLAPSFDRARRINTGLYLLLVHNEEEAPVRDRNPARRVVIPSNAGTLKPGKFEGGLIGRQRENYRHAHRRLPNGDEQHGIYPDLIQRLLVLDLSAVADEVESRTSQQPKPERSWPGVLRTLETCLKRRVRQFLSQRQYCDPGQNGRAESRFLRPNVVVHDDELGTLMTAVLDQHGLRCD